METIKNSLNQISEAWNSFFLKYKFCQEKINFTEDVETNYYGDIISYFNDTISFLSDIKYETDFQKSLFQSIGILQTMYVHQDLIDELLYIFKIESSSTQDKNPLREIRNEVIGHPVRKLKRYLLSSVFLAREFKNGNIHYVRYNKADKFKGEEKLYKLPSLITDHIEYLKKFLDIIWKKISKILLQFKKKLLVFRTLVEQEVDFKNILKMVAHYYESIYDDNFLFKEDILNPCFDRRNEHPRYNYAIQLFLETLKTYLSESINYIDELLSGKPENIDLMDISKVKFKIVTKRSKKLSRSDDFQYGFSKLLEKHPVFGITYFKKEFKKDKIILDELENMEAHIDSNLEYYASYEYLRKLFIKRGLLRI